MNLRDDLIGHLEEANDTLRQRVGELEGLLGLRFESPPQLGLTRQESKIFGLLMKLPLVAKETAIRELYLHSQDEAEIKIVDVFVCKMRKKLEPHGIEILTQWGQGYYLDKTNKARADALLKELAA